MKFMIFMALRCSRMKFSVWGLAIRMKTHHHTSTNWKSTCRFFLYKVPTKNCWFGNDFGPGKGSPHNAAPGATECHEIIWNQILVLQMKFMALRCSRMKFSVWGLAIHMKTHHQPSTNSKSTCHFFWYKVPTKNCWFGNDFGPGKGSPHNAAPGATECHEIRFWSFKWNFLPLGILGALGWNSVLEVWLYTWKPIISHQQIQKVLAIFFLYKVPTKNCWFGNGFGPGKGSPHNAAPGATECHEIRFWSFKWNSWPLGILGALWWNSVFEVWLYTWNHSSAINKFRKHLPIFFCIKFLLKIVDLSMILGLARVPPLTMLVVEAQNAMKSGSGPSNEIHCP